MREKAVAGNITGCSDIRAISLAGEGPDAFLLFAVINLIFAAYLPALDNDFLEYDDDKYITKNFVVRAGITVEGMIWATGFRVSNWRLPLPPPRRLST